MDSFKRRCLGLCLVGAVLIGMLGCTGAGANSLLPVQQKLTDQAKYVRDNGPGPGGVPSELSKTVLVDYILEPGDGLLIEPIQFDSPLRLPVDQVIQADGTIDIGRFGRPVVAGRTIPEVEAMIESSVARIAGDEIQPDARQVNVRLIDAQSKVYYVFGEVASPGSFPLRGRETVLDAIVAAGGLSARASTCNIILSRPTGPGSCRIVLPVCYDQIVQLGDSTTNYQMMPGDRIFVASGCMLECLKFGKRKTECPQCCNQQCPCPAGMTIGPPPVYSIPVHFGEQGVGEPISIPPLPLTPAPTTSDADLLFPLHQSAAADAK